MWSRLSGSLRKRYRQVISDGYVNLYALFVEQALQWVLDHRTEYNIAAVNLSLATGNVPATQGAGELEPLYKKLEAQGVFIAVASGSMYAPGSPERTRPIRFDYDEPGRALLVEWADGTTHHIPFGTLRRACPCAACSARRTAWSRSRRRRRCAFASAAPPPCWSGGSRGESASERSAWLCRWRVRSHRQHRERWQRAARVQSTRQRHVGIHRRAT